MFTEASEKLQQTRDLLVELIAEIEVAIAPVKSRGTLHARKAASGLFLVLGAGGGGVGGDSGWRPTPRNRVFFARADSFDRFFWRGCSQSYLGIGIISPLIWSAAVWPRPFTHCDEGGAS